MTEGSQHKAGVAYLAEIGKKAGWERKINFQGPAGKGGWQFPPMIVPWQNKPWTPIADLFFIRLGCPFILEVNGMKPGQGHSSDRAANYDQQRYEFMRDNFGIKTIPFKTTELVGKDKMDEDGIQMEIWYWLCRQEIRKL